MNASAIEQTRLEEMKLELAREILAKREQDHKHEIERLIHEAEEARLHAKAHHPLPAWVTVTFMGLIALIVMGALSVGGVCFH